MEIYNSTLRDGAQMHKISFSVSDRIKIIKKLDEFGIDYIEAGNPGSNPKEREFFNKIEELDLDYSKIVAFGSTRRTGIKAEEDDNLKALIQAKTLVIAGTRDVIKEEHTRLIASRIPRSELAFIKGNHFIANKQPGRFNQAVLEFLKG